MKTKRLLISLLILCTSLTAYSQDIFDTLAEDRNISVITITKALFNLIPNAGDNAGVEIAHMKDKLDRLDIFTAENPSSIKRIKAFANQELKSKKKYEVLMMMRDEDSETVFYVERGSGERIRSFIMYTEEKEDCTLIRLVGSFTLEDVQKVAEGIK